MKPTRKQQRIPFPTGKSKTMTAEIIIRHPAVNRTLKTSLNTVASLLLNLNERTDCNVNIVLTDDKEVKGLNKKYRNKNSTTNVLSFPSAENGSEDFFPAVILKELGDIVISIDTAAKEAESSGQTLFNRLSWLMTHGFLHLLGYDHEISGQEAAIMADREQELLSAVDHLRRPVMPHLAVNVDHVATIREARGITEPDPVTAAAICELAGAKGIVVHLREDRRHIQDRDVRILRETVQTKLNLEMGATKSIIAIALDLKPDMVTFVPEKRQELTTEGGLDVITNKKKIAKAIEKMTNADIPVSLFIDPDSDQIKTAHEIGATFVELHTGRYADAEDEIIGQQEFDLIEASAEEAFQLGLRVNAGHGLNYQNTAPIAAIDTIEELSIGHAIIGRSVFTGLDQAVREMQEIIMGASF